MRVARLKGRAFLLLFVQLLNYTRKREGFKMETNNGVQIIDYNVVLADLKRKRDELNAAIAGIEAMLLGAGAPIATPAGASPTPTTIGPDTFFGMSIAQAAQKYLNMKKRPQTAPEIAAALIEGGLQNQSGKFPNTVGSVLNRNSEGDAPTFVKVSRGTFALRTWYPNYRPKAKGEKDDDGNKDGKDLV